MSCNCDCNGNNCGLPSQPNYNNLNKGFIVPKQSSCDCGGDKNKVCRNGQIVVIDKNHLYPHEGIYLEDKSDGNQILHIALRPNDYTYVVNFNNNDNFYVTHIFITYKEDNSNNCNNIYKLYIDNKRECHPIEIRIDDNLKQFNNFHIEELYSYIDNPDEYKYLKGKFFRLRSMRTLEIEVSKPMNSIRINCDDNIIKNNLKHIKHYNINADNIIYDENEGVDIAEVHISFNDFSYIAIDEYCYIVYIHFSDAKKCNEFNYEYKFIVVDRYGTDASYIFDYEIIWANDEAPDFSDGSIYEISVSQNDYGNWFGVWTKY